MWNVRGREINLYKVLMGNLKEGDQLQDLGVDRRIILK
jgi:hypothetical protein